jgi:hypothetical protein
MEDGRLRTLKPKDFQKLRERDGYCLHCGETEAVSPNHRANRGMGGFKAGDVPSNLVLLCSVFNGLIESSPKAADLARANGWKLSRYENPAEIPVRDTLTGELFLLNDSFGRNLVPKKEIQICQ